MPLIEYKFAVWFCLVADQGEVRCKSVATIITVIDTHLCAGHKSEYSPSTSEGMRVYRAAQFCANVFGYEKRSHFRQVWGELCPFCADKIATLFIVFYSKKRFFVFWRFYVG